MGECIVTMTHQWRYDQRTWVLKPITLSGIRIDTAVAAKYDIMRWSISEWVVCILAIFIIQWIQNVIRHEIDRHLCIHRRYSLSALGHDASSSFGGGSQLAGIYRRVLSGQPITTLHGCTCWIAAWSLCACPDGSAMSRTIVAGWRADDDDTKMSIMNTITSDARMRNSVLLILILVRDYYLNETTCEIKLRVSSKLTFFYCTTKF